MTYDDALIMQKDYKRAAFNIRRFLHDFPPAHGYANHWGRIATLVDNAPSPAIGFWMTSVANNPFEGEWNEEAEGTDPPDWGKYWDVYVMVEKHERQQDAGTSGG